MEELQAKYDSRASFYGKANVEVQKNSYELVRNLYSYNTLVGSIIMDFTKSPIIEKYIYLGKFSQTTTRHQKEFFKQNGLSDKEIEELFKNGQLERLV